MKDKYLHFSTEELVCDDDFIKWALSPSPDADSDWHRWIQAHPRKKKEVEEAKRILKAIHFKEPEISIDKEKLWNRIRESSIEIPSQPVGNIARRKILRYIAYASIAAGIALIVLFTFTRSGKQTVVTSRGEKIALQLPDQSKVQMNAASRLSYNPKHWSEQRMLTLIGEAFFEVEPGAPFIITTSLGQVEVLGTSFNVFSRDENFRVQCHTGQVNVTILDNGDSELLSPGESCYFSQTGSLQKEVFDATSPADWLANIFRFENQPLSLVFEELERQFAVEVQAEKRIMDDLYTGFFSGRDLEEALHSICWPMQLQFNKKGTTIVITSSRPE